MKMNLLLCLLAGAAVGSIAYSVLNLNAARGLFFSAVVGAIGAYFGGRILAPAFVSGSDEATSLSLVAFFIATTSALVVVKIADSLYRRFQF
jgi:uncharacterized membrane protein YeaQ/YmgE (transglycosylase-associated protein family)